MPSLLSSFLLSQIYCSLSFVYLLHLTCNDIKGRLSCTQKHWTVVLHFIACNQHQHQHINGHRAPSLIVILSITATVHFGDHLIFLTALLLYFILFCLTHAVELVSQARTVVQDPVHSCGADVRMASLDPTAW